MATKKKNPAAVALGRKGGKARAKKLTKEEMSEQNRKAIQARWEKYRAQQDQQKSIFDNPEESFSTPGKMVVAEKKKAK